VSYTRGSDLSGSFQGAGGIGGLLARTDHSTINPTHAFYHADGNGNIAAMVNAQQLTVARYEYDPFGNTLSKSGPLADANAYRFSSQEYHQNSGLLLYLYRAYDPNLQRFINRDPIDEFGGINLYGFVGNDPLGRVDLWGLKDDSDDPFAGLGLDKGCPTAVSGGRENWGSDFNRDFDQFGHEVGKEMGKNAACSAAGWGIGKALGAIAKKGKCLMKECSGFFKKKPARLITKAKLDKLYPRVTPRKGLRDEVWERSKTPNGKVYDPSGREIKPGDPWELGHRAGEKFSDAQRRAYDQGWDGKTWRDYQNDPDIYRPELPGTNAGHRYEDQW